MRDWDPLLLNLLAAVSAACFIFLFAFALVGAST